MQSGETALHVASRYGHPEMVALLCQSRANLDIQDEVRTHGTSTYTTWVCRHTCTHITHMCTCKHSCTPHTHARAHKHTHTHAHTFTHTHTHACAHTHKHTRITSSPPSHPPIHRKVRQPSIVPVGMVTSPLWSAWYDRGAP